MGWRPSGTAANVSCGLSCGFAPRTACLCEVVQQRRGGTGPSGLLWLGQSWSVQIPQWELEVWFQHSLGEDSGHFHRAVGFPEALPQPLLDFFIRLGVYVWQFLAFVAILSTPPSPLPFPSAMHRTRAHVIARAAPVVAPHRCQERRHTALTGRSAHCGTLHALSSAAVIPQRRMVVTNYGKETMAS